MEEFLLVDPRIRDWVLLPILAVNVLVALLRNYVSRYFKSPPKGTLNNVREIQLLGRAQALRKHGGYLPAESFRMHKAFFVHKEHGVLVQSSSSSSGVNPMMAMSDPSNMTNMMKNNLTMLIPQVVLMAWVSYFFAGFVVMKLPFSLTPRFKMMLQRGILFDSLDVSYVSSLSWYFLVVFGLRGLLSIIMGDENTVDEAKVMQAQMTAGMSAAPAQFDKAKAFTSEHENVELARHSFLLHDIEQRYVRGFDAPPSSETEDDSVGKFPDPPALINPDAEHGADTLHGSLGRPAQLEGQSQPQEGGPRDGHPHRGVSGHGHPGAGAGPVSGLSSGGGGSGVKKQAAGPIPLGLPKNIGRRKGGRRGGRRF